MASLHRQKIHWLLGAVVVGGTLALVVAFLDWRSARLAAEAEALAAAIAERAARFPRNAAGKPDFSGTYDVTTLTPYVRYREYGDELIMDEDDARKHERLAREDLIAEGAPLSPDRPPPERGAEIDERPHDLAWITPGAERFTIHGQYRTSILTDPADGRLPELSELGVKRRAERLPGVYKNDGTAWWLASGEGPYDGPEVLRVHDRCLYKALATVPVRPVLENNMKTIVQTDEHLVIHIEFMHWARIVRLNSEHRPPHIRSLAGDSIGWWEGDTLVVETTNFLETPTEPRDGLKVVERFSPLDERRLLYAFTVHDPEYVSSYGGEYPWPKSQHKSYEYACHEANYSLANTLRGARQLEREWLAEQQRVGGM